MALVLAQAPMPISDPVVKLEGEARFRGLISVAWQDYLNRLVAVVDQVPTRVGEAELAAQTASIGATDLTDGGRGAGLYALEYYARITVPAGSSSSLTVTLAWTDGGVAQSQAGAAITGNTTTTRQHARYLFRSDNLAPMTYATTYSSTGSPAMQYGLYVVLYQVKA